MSKVYYVPWRQDSDMVGKFRKIIRKSNILDNINKEDRVAIKLHVGEYKNPAHVHPLYLKELVSALLEIGCEPFLTDTTTYYCGNRFTAVGMIKNAFYHGFSLANIGSPFIVADGLGGDEGFSVKVSSPLNEIYVPSLFKEVDKMIVFSHCKGHGLTAFGGSIKNVAMGCVTKKSKLQMHKFVNFCYDESLCNGCDACKDACGRGIPILKNGKRVMSLEKREDCMHCPACMEECKTGAIKLKELEALGRVLPRAVEGIFKVIGKENVTSINWGANIVEYCDCMPFPGKTLRDNVGIYLSKDIVAIDKAFLDDANKNTFMIDGRPDPEIQTIEGEKIGIGTMDYEKIIL
ncbi:MAG: hypothetical protein APG12_01248 [Candidatus Methanofastidiosum methylothiophilum]|uniref:4Fe-4S ferredoxin-type domain-containing protein n=1 Tax=Candidatus Methanofastidiosum methylothiophilum TaxID=1705564 RepID=A0A150IXT6_9EURY|nr:MAG: hypothetical protein APG10_01015 [Candidatus Methanofastidiosum methylthiophilus]KYC47338.1 MAG: hypothetical protein APG11_01243 [Candidatus Methanofastidiosum methylthiophilus]KYC49789.1 MAG: hypothetical protein APG12_01248 [Candidatus Methanofastidiosum methylthiophilus]